MKTRMSLLAVAIAVFALAQGGGSSRVAAQTHDHPAQPQAAAPAAEHMMHDQMMAAMQARDARLESLVKTMDGTTGPAKIETMAAVIRELVQEEKAMHAHMDDMHQHMAAGHAATPK